MGNCIDCAWADIEGQWVTCNRIVPEMRQSPVVNKIIIENGKPAVYLPQDGMFYGTKPIVDCLGFRPLQNV